MPHLSDRFCGKLYQKHFKGAKRVLLRDGFERMRNADYVLVTPFSDLHATFGDEDMDGFGDFLIVGDEYRESGGPAYAVAIHLTFIDPDQDNAMQIYHFVSDRRTPQRTQRANLPRHLQRWSQRWICRDLRCSTRSGCRVSGAAQKRPFPRPGLC